MKLLNEITNIAGYTQSDLKKSDGSDAGSSDTTTKPVDVQFSMMRNMINTNGGVTGADVADYLERAADINDQVDTVGFVIETDDDDYIKIYVNATQADEFEAEMAKLLGLEDDPEAAINTLAQKFDIVDVVWPNDEEPGDEADLTIDNADALAPADEPGEELDDETGDEATQAELDATATDVADSATPDEEAGEADETEITVDPDEQDENADKEDVGTDEDGTETEEEDAEAEGDRPKKKKDKASTEKKVEPVKDEVKEGRFVLEAKVGDRTVGFTSQRFQTYGSCKEAASKLSTPEITYIPVDIKEFLEDSLDNSNTKQGETDMIGSNFLKRVITEAEDRDGVRDGMNIPLDSQYRALVAQLKRPIEKKLVALYAMTGIPGRYVNSVDGIKDRVMAAADMLRKQLSVRRAFDEFYTALATAKGFAPKETVSEAADLNESKLKRGSFIQKKMETILTVLGLPDELVTTEGPGVAAPMLYRTAKLIDQDANLQAALNKLAIRLGIKAVDVAAPVGEALEEEVDVGNDEFFQKVIALAQALGVPERNLQFQRPNLVRSLREKKMSLQARGMIETRMDQLMALIQKNTRKSGEEPVQEAKKSDDLHSYVQYGSASIFKGLVELAELMGIKKADVKKFVSYGEPVEISGKQADSFIDAAKRNGAKVKDYRRETVITHPKSSDFTATIHEDDDLHFVLFYNDKWQEVIQKNTRQAASATNESTISAAEVKKKMDAFYIAKRAREMAGLSESAGTKTFKVLFSYTAKDGSRSSVTVKIPQVRDRAHARHVFDYEYGELQKDKYQDIKITRVEEVA